jgi:hypothetical protein
MAMTPRKPRSRPGYARGRLVPLSAVGLGPEALRCGPLRAGGRSSVPSCPAVSVRALVAVVALSEVDEFEGLVGHFDADARARVVGH